MIRSILFVVSLYRPHIGGIETFVDGLSCQLQAQGIRCSVLTKRYPHDLPEYEDIRGIKTIRIIRPETPSDFADRARVLLQHEDTLRSDIVITVGVRRPMPLFALALARRWKVPSVAHYAGYDLPHQSSSESIQAWAEGQSTVPESVTQFDAHWAFTPFLARLARETFGKSIPNVSVMPVGIDHRLFESAIPFQASRPYILCARRLVKDKGLDILLRAYQHVVRDHPEIDLRIVGDGPLFSILKNLAHPLQTSQHSVCFHGSLSLPDLASLYRGAIVSVCPSKFEGGGTVNIEAKAARCPVIGSNSGGIPDFIHHEHDGLLFQSGSEESLAYEISRIITDRELRHRLRENGYTNSLAYHWPNVTECYLNKLRDIEVTTLPHATPWNTISEQVFATLG